MRTPAMTDKAGATSVVISPQLLAGGAGTLTRLSAAWNLPEAPVCVCVCVPTLKK